MFWSRIRLLFKFSPREMTGQHPQRKIILGENFTGAHVPMFKQIFFTLENWPHNLQRGSFQLCQSIMAHQKYIPSPLQYAVKCGSSIYIVYLTHNMIIMIIYIQLWNMHLYLSLCSLLAAMETVHCPVVISTFSVLCL